MAKFFIKPFATAGTKTTVPDATDSSGYVSYNEGYGADYSRVLGTDPLAKAIERTKLNAVLYDITDAIKQYQTHGVPDFITTADNGGTAYPYSIYSIVRYDSGSGFHNYMSLKDNNTSLPTVTSDWKVDPFSTDIAALIHAATSKSTPVDADELGIIDSAASYGLKKLTWSNLKNTLMNILNFPAGTVVNVARYATNTMSTGTGQFPYDDTIPQITEGTQFMSLNYTPKKIGNLLIIDVVANYSVSSSGTDGVALFNGSNDAIAMGGSTSSVTAIPHVIKASLTVTSLTPIPFTVRIGTNGATVTFNGAAGVRVFGGALLSSITVTEIAQ